MATQEREAHEVSMYGITAEQIEQQYLAYKKYSRDKTRLTFAATLLSDAQEALILSTSDAVLDDYYADRARQLINIAKFLISQHQMKEDALIRAI